VNCPDSFRAGQDATHSAKLSGNIGQTSLALAFCSSRTSSEEFFRGIRSVIGDTAPIVVAYLREVSSETAKRSLRRSNDLIAMVEERNRAMAEIERLLDEKQHLIEQLSTVNAQLSLMANTDPLTGICNRRRTIEVLSSEISRYQRYGSKVSVLLFDIDNFKLFNDTHGHQVGDNVLKHVSSLVSRHIRSADTFGRYGGEEFVIVLPETDLESGTIVAQKLRNLIRHAPLETRRHDLRVTASFGVTECLEVDTVETVLKRVDHAMYEAKAQGRDRVMMAILRLSSSPASPEASSSSLIECISAKSGQPRVAD
jgi:diguanylate cyclase (GGDEF)-like protein